MIVFRRLTKGNWLYCSTEIKKKSSHKISKNEKERQYFGSLSVLVVRLKLVR